MVASLRALLKGVIDYAGLFPPAELPMEAAMRNFAQYQKSQEKWLVSRFVCPVGQLENLAPFLEEFFRNGPPLTLTVVDGGRKEPDLSADVAVAVGRITSFLRRHGLRVAIEALEVRLIESLDSERIKSHLIFIESFLIDKDPFRALYVETSLGPDWRSAVSGLAMALADAKGRGANGVSIQPGPRGSITYGFKLRCGGREPAAIPTVEQVAFAITACRDGEIRLKFTAGLHHPLRHFDHGLQSHMHGFINVFGAGVLAHARRLGEHEVRAILADEDARDFVFTEDGFRWKDIQASAPEIVEARQRLVVSFGSCSVDEPRDALRMLGWLD